MQFLKNIRLGTMLGVGFAIVIGINVPNSHRPRKRENKPIAANPAPMLAATKITARPEVWSAACSAARSSWLRARSSRKR